MTDREDLARIGAKIDRLGSGSGSTTIMAAIGATRMSFVISDPLQADNPIVYANEAFIRLTGYAREDVLGRNCRFLQGSATDMGEVARLAEGIRCRVPVEVELQNYRKDGGTFWNRLFVVPVLDRKAEPIYFFASQFDITHEHERVDDLDARLRHNEVVLDALLRSSSEVRYRLTADWGELRQLTGGDFIADTATDRRGWLEAYIPPVDRAAVRAEIERAIRTRSTYDLEHRVYRLDGTIGWAASRAVPMFDAAGEITEWYGAASDITERKQAEVELRASEERLRVSEARWRGFFEQLDDGFMVVEIVRDSAGTARSWRFAEANAAWERITGLPFAAARGRTIEDVVPGVEREWQELHIRVAETGEPAALRMPVRELGQLYDVRASRIGPDRVGVLFQEVSQQQQDEARRAALLELNDGLARHDDRARLSDVASDVLGRTLGAQLVGYGAVDLDTETITVERDWIAGGARSLAGTLRFADFGTYFDELRRGETVVVTDVRSDPRTRDCAEAMERRNARAFINTPVFERGRFVALQYVSTAEPRRWTAGELEFCREVAERLRAVIARREAEHDLRVLAASLEDRVEERTRDLQLTQARARAYFDFSNDYLFLVHLGVDGVARIEDMNPACQRVMNLSRTAIAGRPVAELLPTTGADAVALHARACLATGQAQTYLAVREYQEGRKVVIDGRVALVERFSGGGGLLLFSGHDITEQRQIEDALRQAQKMEAVGQLTGGVAHDFNNLLTVIRSSTDLLKRPTLSEERRARYIGAISDTVDRAAKLTGQLLAFARRQTLMPKRFDARDEVRSVVEMLDTLTGSRVRIETALPAEPCFVNVDPSQFDTALVNLAVNARDAMNGEGRLAIEVRAVEGIPPTRAQPAAEGSFVAISLADTGSGIAPGDLAKIFEPFFTTKEVGKGTGLGLSQVFGFVRQSGGEVTVESAVGRGTTFTLYLPRGASESAGASAVEAPDAPTVGYDIRLLVVEDNADVGGFAVQALAELGYRPVLAPNADAALAELARGGDRYDVVFTDVVMPGMTGIELGHEIRRLYPDLPVVLTSGYSHVLAQNGTFGFELLHKPYSVEQLSQTLQKTAAWRRRQQGEAP